MKVSVILNTINEQEEFLSRSINSYLQQVRVEVELIISTIEEDKNISLIQKEYPSVKIVTMPRNKHSSFGIKSPRGSFMQLNNALPHITGEWFSFCAGDDYSYSNKLATEYELCQRTGKEVCYSAYDMIDANNVLIKKVYFHEYDYCKHLTGNFVADSSLISRRLVCKYLPFNIELNNYAYWDLWLRIYKGEGNVFCYNPHPAWAYMQDENSTHIKRFKDPQAMLEAERDREIMLSRHR